MKSQNDLTPEDEEIVARLQADIKRRWHGQTITSDMLREMILEIMGAVYSAPPKKR